MLDNVGYGLVIDGPGHSTEVTGNGFLRASGRFIQDPYLTAGGNYWATATRRRQQPGQRASSALPWKPARRRGAGQDLRCHRVQVPQVDGFVAVRTTPSGSRSGRSPWPE